MTTWTDEEITAKVKEWITPETMQLLRNVADEMRRKTIKEAYEVMCPRCKAGDAVVRGTSGWFHDQTGPETIPCWSSALRYHFGGYIKENKDDQTTRS